MADQLPFLQAAINASPVFDGAGATYELAGDLVLPDGALLSNINLIQLDQTANRKTVTKTGGWIKGLQKVSVHRGTNKAVGNISTSGGIWLSGVRGLHVFDDIEVTGNGPGAGVYMQNIYGPNLGRISVHDMRYSAASNPGTEQIFGIWMNMCSDFKLSAPDVHRIDAEIGGVVRALQTDGITVGGCRAFKIFGAVVSYCGEGIDVTGSNGNTEFEIVGGEIFDCDAFGLKLANSATKGKVRGVSARDCGWSGFVVSGPNFSGVACDDIEFVGCDSLNSGSNGYWSGGHTTGFSLLSSPSYSAYPSNVVFNGCTARDTQAVKTMKYGWRNENNSLTNRLRNCVSTGHINGALLGSMSLG